MPAFVIRDLDTGQTRQRFAATAQAAVENEAFERARDGHAAFCWEVDTLIPLGDTGAYLETEAGPKLFKVSVRRGRARGSIDGSPASSVCTLISVYRIDRQTCPSCKTRLQPLDQIGLCEDCGKFTCPECRIDDGAVVCLDCEIDML